METGSSWLESFRASLAAAIDATAAHAPGVLFAIVVLIAGWFLAKFARVVVRRLVRGSNRLLQNLVPKSRASQIGVPPGLTNLIGHVAFAVVLLLALAAALNLAGFEAAVAWFGRAAIHLPNVIAGFVIILLGYLLGVFVRDQVLLWLPDDIATPGLALPRLAQYTVAGIALIVGLDQMGVDVRFLIALFVVLASAVCIGFSLAFALGARAHVSNLIGTRAAARRVATGAAVRIDGIEGTVVEITHSHLALDTAEGLVYVPGRMIDEHTLTVTADPVANGTGSP